MANVKGLGRGLAGSTLPERFKYTPIHKWCVPARTVSGPGVQPLIRFSTVPVAGSRHPWSGPGTA
jgi:hypothetical protein